MGAALPVKASRLGRPAYEGAPPRVTASMVALHGSYAAARAALSAPVAASPADAPDGEWLERNPNR